MHVDLVHLVFRQVVLLAGSADIGFLEHVALTIMVDESPLSDVELSLFEQEWFLDVFLYDKLKAFEFTFLSVAFICFRLFSWQKVVDTLLECEEVDPIMIPQDTL